MKTKHVSRRFRRFLKANEAVSALEYALLVGVVAVGVGAGVAAFSEQVFDGVESIGNSISQTQGVIPTVDEPDNGGGGD